jgi:hypothetical protein
LKQFLVYYLSAISVKTLIVSQKLFKYNENDKVNLKALGQWIAKYNRAISESNNYRLEQENALLRKMTKIV